jgi:hypothetical protein
MDLDERGPERVDWIHLPRDTDKCQAAVNTIMNLPVPQHTICRQWRSH